MRTGEKLTFVVSPGLLREGLFGQVLLYIFEILPLLRELKIFPNWSIASRLYGTPPDYQIIPGILETAYAPPTTSRAMDMLPIRDKYGYALGSDWAALHTLWSAYFKLPARIIQSADEFGDLSYTLGVHYRGNDKNTTSWDANPINYEDFQLIIADFLRNRPEISQILVATDEDGFIEHLRQTVAVPVLTPGAGKFHKSLYEAADSMREADNALRDCLLLSRCGAVLQTSSALSAFAKVLRPDLEIYRCGASKFFADRPYFPTAYIPIYSTTNDEVRALLSRTLRDDWTREARAAPYLQTFAYRPRRSPLGRATWPARSAIKRVIWRLMGWKGAERPTV